MLVTCSECYYRNNKELGGVDRTMGGIPAFEVIYYFDSNPNPTTSAPCACRPTSLCLAVPHSRPPRTIHGMALPLLFFFCFFFFILAYPSLASWPSMSSEPSIASPTVQHSHTPCAWSQGHQVCIRIGTSSILQALLRARAQPPSLAACLTLCFLGIPLVVRAQPPSAARGHVLLKGNCTLCPAGALPPSPLGCSPLLLALLVSPLQPKHALGALCPQHSETASFLKIGLVLFFFFPSLFWPLKVDPSSPEIHSCLFMLSPWSIQAHSATAGRYGTTSSTQSPPRRRA